MSLINYVEPVSAGEAFAGVGMLILSLVMAYILYRVYIKFAQWIDVIINRESKYELLQEAMLDEIAKKKGINLEAALVKRKMIDVRRKSFRRKVEDEVFAEMFGKDDKKKE